MMKCEIRTCHTSDGFALKFRHFKSSPHGLVSGQAKGKSSSPFLLARGSVVAVHGVQSHSGWYRDSSMAIARSGWDVYFADRRGSGLNGRNRGHADHGIRLLNDLKLLVELAKQENPDQPVVLLGLSWGGKLASAFAATYPYLVQRLVLLYPATDSMVGPNWRQKLMLKLARHHDVRKRLVALPFADPNCFTNLPNFQDRIANDPLALNSVTTGFLNATTDLDRIVQQQSTNITMPTLLMLAEADRIVNNRKVKRRLQSWPVSDLSTIEYSDAEHTLEFCSQRIDFFQDLIHWLNRSLPTDAVQVCEASDK